MITYTFGDMIKRPKQTLLLLLGLKPDIKLFSHYSLIDGVSFFCLSYSFPWLWICIRLQMVNSIPIQSFPQDCLVHLRKLPEKNLNLALSQKLLFPIYTVLRHIQGWSISLSLYISHEAFLQHHYTEAKRINIIKLSSQFTGHYWRTI